MFVSVFRKMIQSNKIERIHIFFLSLIVFVGMSLSLFVFHIIKQKKDEAKRTHFFREADILTQSIERFFHNYTVILDFLPSLFESREEISYSRFIKFSQTIKTMNPNAVIEYMPLVRKKERISFEKKARTLFPEYRLKERDQKGQIQEMLGFQDLKERKFFFPLYYTSHISSVEQKRFLGFDVFSSPVHRKAIIQSIETGKKAVTDPFFLLREDEKRNKSFVVFKPIYDITLPQKTKKEKWKAALGVVSTVIRAEDLLAEFFRFEREFYSKKQERMSTNFLEDWKRTFHYYLSFFYFSENRFNLIYSVRKGLETEYDLPKEKNLHEKFIYVESKEDVKSVKKSFFFSPSLIYSHTYSWMGRTFKWFITSYVRKNFFLTYWEAYLVLFFCFLSTGLSAQLMLAILRKRFSFQRELGLKNKEVQYNKKYLSTLLNTMFEALISTNEKGIIQFVNPATTKIFGYNSEELLGESVQMLMPTKYSVKYEGHLKRYKETGERCVVIPKRKEFEGIRKNGEVFPLSLVVNKVEMDGKKVFIVTIGDLTQEKKVEKEMKEAIEQLSQANSDLQSFNYIVSYDLREPLRVVVNFIELLKGRLFKIHSSDEKVSKYMQFILSSVTRMQDLLGNLVEYLKMTQSSSRIKEIELDKIVLNVLGNLQNLIRSSEAEVIYKNLPIVVSEPVLLTCVLQNLVENGIKYRKKDSKALIIIKVQEKKNQWVCSVEDNGIGIEKKYFSKIFLPFTRLHSRYNDLGTGMGLALCSKVVGNLGGSIWLESKAGTGTTFYFTLPKPSNLSKEKNEEEKKASA